MDGLHEMMLPPPSLVAKVGYQLMLALSIWCSCISPRFVRWQTMGNDVGVREAA